MAFTTIPSALIQVGKAIKKSLWQYTKDNFDDLDSRLTSVENTSSLIEIMDETFYSATTAATLTGLYFYRAKQATRITKVQVQIFEKGVITTGLLTVDLKKSSTLGGTFSTILTTPPTVDFSTDPDYTSEDAVINNLLNDLVTNDFLRLDVTALPSTPLSKFRLIVTGELI